MGTPLSDLLLPLYHIARVNTIYKNAGGQRKTKWISLGLSEKGNKRKAESELARLRAEFEPPKEVGDLSSDMLFADYLLEWLEIAKGRLAHATYGAYHGPVSYTHLSVFCCGDTSPKDTGGVPDLFFKADCGVVSVSHRMNPFLRYFFALHWSVR